MNLFQWAHLFFEAQVMVLFLSVVLFIVYGLWVREKVAVSAGTLLFFSIASFVVALLLPVAFSFLSSENLLRPSVQVFSEIKQNAVVLAPKAVEGAVSSNRGFEIQANPLYFFLGVYLLVTLVGFTRFLRSALQLRKLIVTAHYFRKVRSLSILYSDNIDVPFSFWSPFISYIVLSRSVLGDFETLKLALRHEGEHHRAGHTVWAFTLEVFRILFFPNPGVHIILRILGELQEFACDEALVGQLGVSSHAYGRCLFEVAQSATGVRNHLPGTTSMASSIAGITLKRRIKMILQKKTASITATLFVAVGTLLALSTMAYASHSFVQDRKITLEEAMHFRDIASRNTEIPLAMNELVLRELNVYLGTVEGKRFLEGALQRMPMYQRMIDEKISQFRLTKDLLVVAFGESGFKNITGKNGGGIWQFMAQTARRYHLVVDKEVDERLDVDKETVAAMEYLRDLFLEFKDWRLALKAYNEGEVHVRSQMVKYNSQSAWEIELKEEGRDRYLAKMTALLIILKNPSMIE